MDLKIGGIPIAASPSEFQVTPLDLDNGESSIRTANGTLTRDRIAIKRQIDMSFGILTWPEMSSILTAMGGMFFDFYYPDPMEGIYVTKRMYVGNRPSGVAVSKDGVILWKGLKIVLTEQ